MATEILRGPEGAVLYNPKTRIAFGPVFDSGKDASCFLNFLSGLDPSQFWGSWEDDTSTGRRLYAQWVSCGKLPERPLMQFDEAEFLHSDCDEHRKCVDCDEHWDLHQKGGDIVAHCTCLSEWNYKKDQCRNAGRVYWFMSSCSFVEECFPLFNGRNNNQVLDLLEKHNIVRKTDDVDSESSCIFAKFKTKRDGQAFIKRLNKFLRENWHKAYPDKKASKPLPFINGRREVTLESFQKLRSECWASVEAGEGDIRITKNGKSYATLHVPGADLG